jgi:hypothetical protein
MRFVLFCARLFCVAWRVFLTFALLSATCQSSA